ncbi:LytTR family transcriptional regulator DNA-binding domain-containing protein [Natronoflexus pectinivorans]|uniref:DNA-binding LytR/AlgR family response regulator n=1 Tax=Natronoflexus pectinivorans TaxID=682526 RepID=A0A4V2RW49_9BACT|nr:LytTR family transcriptional regulator DNA-binding domain-containing protein [Natronoflexus pectinivorans]TCO06814.1 DNA-binding LytR/AlgR family response regulator [Natronoflexus pectinivorans]
MAIKQRVIAEYFVSPRNTIIQIVFTSLFALFFINLYKPFGAREWYDVNPWIFLLVSGLLVVAGMCVVFISRFTMLMIKRKRKITISGYSVMIAAEVLLMGLLYAILERVVLGDVRPFSVLAYLAVQNTSLILLIPYLITSLYFAWREKKVSFEQLLRQIRTRPAFIPFKDENGTLRITVKATDVLYVEASDNYVDIYYKSGGKTKSYLLRNTLKRLEILLKDYPLVRCHRSFMINLNQVKMLRRVKGQFQLLLDDAGDLIVPVSRSYTEMVVGYFDESTEDID